MRVQTALFLIFLTACRGGEGRSAEGIPAPAKDGWSTFEDSRFRLEVPPGAVAHSSDRLKTERSPQLLIKLSEKALPGENILFSMSPFTTDMLLRDAANVDLKRWVSDGGQALSPVKSLQAKAGTCVAYVAATGIDHCSPSRPKERCNEDHLIAYCDTPLGKRYWFDGPLGSTPSKNQRPPNSARLAADYERILRSIEFK